MGVFKEEVRILEELATKQGWIDNHQRGLLATPEIKNTMKWVLKNLLDFKVAEVTHGYDRTSGILREYSALIHWAVDEAATRIRITYNKDNLHNLEYFIIEFPHGEYFTTRGVAA